MDLKRRLGTAALAAALLALGLGLASYRPRLVPELRPGARVAGVPPSYGEQGGRERAFAAEREAAAPAAELVEPPEELAAAAREEAPSLRDAPAGAAASSARAPVSSMSAFFDPARGPREWLEALDAVETKREGGAFRPEPKSRQPAAGGSLLSRRFSAGPFGTPMFTGPAPAEAEYLDEDEEEAVAPGPAGARSTGRPAGLFRRGTRGFPLFQPPRRAVVRPRAPAARRVRPLLLSKLLGRGALRPPAAAIVPPDLSGLDARKPAGAPTSAASPRGVEARDPRKLGPACRKRGPHWDGALWHHGAARGAAADGGWLWLWKEGARWWARGDAREAPFLRHQSLWWSKQKGVWFALHEGELWSWRRFAAWDAEGLIRLTDGVEIVYSADFKMAAVITPGAGAVLYDAATGAELGSWLESEMPRRRPRAPARLRLPSGI